jgi:pimeloyl-ACP methyl ester carboxylesterase/DNA-binding CsgD family transcriptional regulator
MSRSNGTSGARHRTSVPPPVRYLRTSDGVQIAWSETGSGPTLVKASNWLSHLEYDWESPLWRHWIRFFSDHFHFIRYDERGCGMTDWEVADLSFERWVQDIESVIERVALPQRFALLGISQGASVCIDYAVRHPERVSKLLLYGGYARGWARRGNVPGEREYHAIVDLARYGWGRDNPAFRQIFTSRFVPGATEEQIVWFNELCRKTTSPEMAARLLQARAEVDVLPLLEQVRTPTLVIHARDDVVAPIEEARILAAGIPGAQFVELDSRNHILLEHEPAWKRFREATLSFMGVVAQVEEDPAFAALSPRERDILALIADGLANAEIAERLAISDKTVRNHLSNVFDKLGVWTRAQAIVFARDRGFKGAGGSGGR